METRDSELKQHWRCLWSYSTSARISQWGSLEVHLSVVPWEPGHELGTITGLFKDSCVFHLQKCRCMRYLHSGLLMQKEIKEELIWIALKSVSFLTHSHSSTLNYSAPSCEWLQVCEFSLGHNSGSLNHIFQVPTPFSPLNLTQMPDVGSERYFQVSCASDTKKTFLNMNPHRIQTYTSTGGFKT